MLLLSGWGFVQMIVSTISSNQPFWNLSDPRRSFIQQMKHALTSNHPLGFIYVNPLYHLKLRLDLLLSQLYRENGPQPHKKGRLLLYGEGLIEDDVDVLGVRLNRIRSAVFSPLYLWLFQWLSIERVETPCFTTIGSRKALIYK